MLSLDCVTVFLTFAYFANRMAPRSLYASILSKKKALIDTKKASTDAPASTSAARNDSQVVISPTPLRTVRQNESESGVAVTVGVVSPSLNCPPSRPVLSLRPHPIPSATLDGQGKKRDPEGGMSKVIKRSRKRLRAKATKIRPRKVW